MLLLPVWEWLQGKVFDLPAAPLGARPSFNPYLGYDPLVDRPGADRIRRENLRRYLESFTHWPEILVIGEAPGWRGCRFSGVPFTSEAQLDGRLPFSGKRSSLADQAHSEASATVFWKVMLGYHPRFLAWNSLPLHPHLPEKPLTNRKPARDEIHQTEATLAMLIALLRPQEVIAVGATAAATTRRLGFTPFQVRHPGHGGSAAFQAGVEGVFGRQTRRAVIAKPERMNNRL